jgi:glycerophosphoryl diester phosphodiesterase
MGHRHRRAYAVPLAAAVAGLLVVAGCSGSAGSGSRSSELANANASAATGSGSSTPGTGSRPPIAHREGVPKQPFDLQAHRGGMGLTTEEQPAAYAKALRLGVTTLELDTQVSADGHVLVNHDRLIDGRKCRDTGPVSVGDTAYPYVGKAISTLTITQLRSLDCGFQRFPGFEEQEVVTGAHLPELKHVVAQWSAAGARDVWFDIEIKFDPAKPEESVGRGEFTQRVVDEIVALGIGERTLIQSFDWLTLTEVHRLQPTWPLVALTSSDEFGPTLAAGVAGVAVYSPRETIVTRGMVEEAHRLGLRVIPWTVDDPSRMETLIALGVDGLITNYPDRARTVMAKAGMPLPPQAG